MVEEGLGGIGGGPCEDDMTVSKSMGNTSNAIALPTA